MSAVPRRILRMEVPPAARGRSRRRVGRGHGLHSARRGFHRHPVRAGGFSSSITASGPGRRAVARAVHGVTRTPDGSIPRVRRRAALRRGRATPATGRRAGWSGAAWRVRRALADPRSAGRFRSPTPPRPPLPVLRPGPEEDRRPLGAGFVFPPDRVRRVAARFLRGMVATASTSPPPPAGDGPKGPLPLLRETRSVRGHGSPGNRRRPEIGKHGNRGDDDVAIRTRS